MPTFSSLFSKAYWTLATVGIVWAVFIGCLVHPTVQRQYVCLDLLIKLGLRGMTADEPV